MLKRGDIIKNSRTGRLQVVREIRESQDIGYFWLTTLKVRKDGIGWGRNEVSIVTADKPLPHHYFIVDEGHEPAALEQWREN